MEAFASLRSECTAGNCQDCFYRRKYILAIAGHIAADKITVVQGVELVDANCDPNCTGPEDTPQSRDGCMPKECQHENGPDFYSKKTHELDLSVSD